MTIARVLERLPHGFPFRLVDRVLMVEPDAWAVVLKSLARNDPLVDENGVLPPMLLCEMMAQAAGLAVTPPVPRTAAMLAAVDRFRCRPPVIAGQPLLVIARVKRRFGLNIKVRALVWASGSVRAAGDLVLHLVPPPATT